MLVLKHQSKGGEAANVEAGREGNADSQARSPNIKTSEPPEVRRQVCQDGVLEVAGGVCIAASEGEGGGGEA